MWGGKWVTPKCHTTITMLRNNNMQNKQVPLLRRGAFHCAEQVFALYANTKTQSDRKIISTVGKTAVLETELGGREEWILSEPQPVNPKHYHLLVDERCYEFSKPVAKTLREREDDTERAAAIVAGETAP